MVAWLSIACGGAHPEPARVGATVAIVAPKASSTVEGVDSAPEEDAAQGPAVTSPKQEGLDEAARFGLQGLLGGASDSDDARKAEILEALMNPSGAGGTVGGSGLVMHGGGSAVGVLPSGAPRGNVSGARFTANRAGVDEETTARMRAPAKSPPRPTRITLLSVKAVGLSPDAVSGWLDRNDPSVRTCYETALGRVPTAEGSVGVEVVFGKDGHLVKASVTRASGITELDACVLEVVMHMSFPKLASDATVTAEIAFRTPPDGPPSAP